MKRTKVPVRINSIRQAGSNRPNLPGNLIINQKLGEDAKPENWYSSREFRNALLGKKLNPDLPLDFFIGCTIVAERLEIEPVDVEGGKSVTINLPGKGTDGKPRTATFKQVGVHNINLDVDTSSMNIDKYMAIAELSMKFTRRSATMAAAPAVTAPEPLTEIMPTPPVETPANEPATQNEPVHQDLNQS